MILQIVTDTATISSVSGEVKFLYSFWFWCTIFEFAIIIFLIIRIRSKKNKLAFFEVGTDKIRDARNQNIDMENLMNSITDSRKLYKELSKKCHPDLFTNSTKYLKAEEIFQEITKNQRNFEKLSALKIRAIQELNINL